ncbi:MAG: PIN domain-containing protein [Nitrospiraceae bacterium]|nr:PIN domain-containing protein [Nitrospiraceae bacterium]
MKVFLDTSAFFALLDRDDSNHKKAKEQWNGLLDNIDNSLVATNYVLVESFALVQHRLGPEAARGLQENLLPLVNVEWIDAETHRAAMSAFLAASRRKLSLVDCVSFESMRTLGIKTAFAFDPHFKEQGFKLVP